MSYTFEKIYGQQATYLVWLDNGQTMTVGIDPSRTDVAAAVDEVVQFTLDADKNTTPPVPTYRELRAEAYPSVQDQLDIIFHSGIDVWKQQIQSIKDKYPKV